MDLLYRGFDGLDLSFQGRIDHRLCAALENAKSKAQKYHRDEYLEWCGIGMLVAENGARGGYAFCVRTESPQAVWFFKKPNPNDLWGVRVSCASFQLAVYGYSQTKVALIHFLEKLKIRVPPNGESISRVDFAMDFLCPDLVLEPDHFVMHSNCHRSDHYASSELNARGSSGRVTSVTVGQMPGRQIIVYDKRAEVLAKRKAGWFEIWNSQRQREGKPPLDFSNPTKSRIWRVEIRAGKRHLKDSWAIRTWDELERRIGDVFSHSLFAVRYTAPTDDTNRARWPDAPVWVLARELVKDELFIMRSFAGPEAVKRVQFDKYDELLTQQIAGLIISRAALHQTHIDDLSTFSIETVREIGNQFSNKPKEYESRLLKAGNRFSVLHPKP